MNLRGVYIRVEQTNNRNDFNIVTSPILFERYDWFVKNLDAYLNLAEDKSIDIDGVIAGSKLRSMMQNLDYCIFGKLIGFPSKLQEPIDLKTYDEFFKSKAILVIMIYDVYYYDIYCKDETLLYSLVYNAERHEMKFEWIDEENDTRTRFDVW